MNTTNDCQFRHAWRRLTEQLEMCLITYDEYSERADRLARIEATTQERRKRRLPLKS